MHTICTPALSKQTTPLSARERGCEVKRGGGVRGVRRERKFFEVSKEYGAALMELQVPWCSATRRALCSLGVCVCVCVSRGVEVDRYCSQSESGGKGGEWKLEEG